MHTAKLAFLLLPLSVLAAPLHAHAASSEEDGVASDEAPNREEAKRRYQRALELFNEGSYDASLLEFERAYELLPSYRILFNIALVNRQLNDYAGALTAFERYLAEGEDKLDEERIAEVQSQIESLRPKVAYLSVEVDEDGAEVAVDAKVVGTSPLDGELLVNAGRRRITVTLGNRQQVKVAEVAGGDHGQLEFAIANAEPLATRPPPPSAASSDEAQNDFPWIAWGATGLLAAGAVTTGFLALDARSQQDEQKDRLGVTRAELDSAASKVDTLALTTDLLLGATAVAAGVSLYLTLSPSSSEEPANDQAIRTELLIFPRGAAARVTF